MTFPFLVPYSMLLYFQSFRELFKYWNEALISRHNLLAIHCTIVDLVLPWFTLFEDARNNALSHETLPQIIHNNCPGSEKSLDVQLVYHTNAQDILSRCHSCCLVPTL